MRMLDNYLWILDNRRELEKERDTRREIMRIGIGNDHSALELKAEIIEFLKEKGHEVVDFGTDSSESCKRSGLWNLNLRYRSGDISCGK